LRGIRQSRIHECTRKTGRVGWPWPRFRPRPRQRMARSRLRRLGSGSESPDLGSEDRGPPGSDTGPGRYPLPYQGSDRGAEGRPERIKFDRDRDLGYSNGKPVEPWIQEIIRVAGEEKTVPDSFESMCNSVLLDMILEEKSTGFTAVPGFCAGHGSMVLHHSEAVCPVLAEMDCLLGHNLLSACRWYRSRTYSRDRDREEEDVAVSRRPVSGVVGRSRC